MPHYASCFLFCFIFLRRHLLMLPSRPLMRDTSPARHTLRSPQRWFRYRLRWRRHWRFCRLLAMRHALPLSAADAPALIRLHISPATTLSISPDFAAPPSPFSRRHSFFCLTPPPSFHADCRSSFMLSYFLFMFLFFSLIVSVSARCQNGLSLIRNMLLAARESYFTPPPSRAFLSLRKAPVQAFAAWREISASPFCRHATPLSQLLQCQPLSCQRPAPQALFRQLSSHYRADASRRRQADFTRHTIRHASSFSRCRRYRHSSAFPASRRCLRRTIDYLPFQQLSRADFSLRQLFAAAPYFFFRFFILHARRILFLRRRLRRVDYRPAFHQHLRFSSHR